MLRLIVIAALFTATATVANADDYSRAGTEGTVTAYELDGHTVIDNKICFRSGRHGSYAYARCGSRLRDTVKLAKCRHGGGTQYFLYQHGSGRMTRSSVYCGRRY